MSGTISSDDLLRLRMRALGLDGLGGVDGSASAAEASARASARASVGASADGAVSSAASGAASDAASDQASSTASGAERIAAVARSMLALQGQDWRSSRWALGVRAPGTAVTDVYEAFNTCRIVRSWPVRGTIHVVAAEDIGWMQRVTNHRVLAGASKRRELLGMSDEVLDRIVDVSLEALRDGDGLDRDQLAAVWTEAGIDWKSNWRYHLIWWLCQNGLATLGPVRGEAEPLLVLAEGWIRSPRELDGDDALAELTARYAAARGPVRAKDLAWWSGLTVREAKRGIELAVQQGRLVPLHLAGTSGASGELWADPELLGAPLGEMPRAAGWRLLPSFDEHLLGYTVRDAQLAPEHFERIVPGRNGMFLATAVHRGRVAGTWRKITRKSGGIEVAPLPGERVDIAALTPEYARWSAFHGLEPGPVELSKTSAD